MLRQSANALCSVSSAVVSDSKTPNIKRKTIHKTQSSANISSIYMNILSNLVAVRGIQKDSIEESNIAGQLLLEAAKLKAAPSASNIKVGSRFRPLNNVEQVYI